VVDVVIGVDTHVHTDCAAIIDSATGSLPNNAVSLVVEGHDPARACCRQELSRAGVYSPVLSAVWLTLARLALVIWQPGFASSKMSGG
jgi:hypothetical protein